MNVKKSTNISSNNLTKNENVNIIDLENLQKKYSNTLTEYKQSISDYINYLNNSKTSNKKLISLKGQSYLGTGNLQQIDNTNLNNCQALCSNNTKCSGATFKSSTCILKTGDSNIIPSSNDSYAIVNEGKILLLKMEKLNNELININEKINEKINNLEPYLNNISREKQNNTNELINNYKNLLEERENIAKLINDYETLEQTENENEIKITQNYYVYILYVILSIVAIFILYKISTIFSSNSASSNISFQQYG